MKTSSEAALREKKLDTERLDYYHRLEREHIHLTLLEEAARGVEDVNAGKILTPAKLKARYGR